MLNLKSVYYHIFMVSIMITIRSFICPFIVQLTYHNLAPNLDIIGYYWSATTIRVVLTKYFLFHKNNCSYRIQDWDKHSKLLPMRHCSSTLFLRWIRPVIQVIAKAGTGDIGVLTGIVVGATLYAILRALEKTAFLER